MIAFLILFLIFVIFLAFFIGHNIGNACAFWLFKDYASMSVLILVFGAFACGIIFSIIVMIVGKYLKSKPEPVVIKQKEEKPKKESRKERKIRKLEEKNKKKKAAEVPVNPD